VPLATASPLRALRHRSFRIFYAGQFLSLIGSWMQTVATSWLVYRLTGSALLLGITTAAQQIPMLFVSPLAGVWADRVNRRQLLIVTQALAAVQASILTVLTFTGSIQVPHVIALSVLLGVLIALETPTRQAFLLEMVEREDLPNAIALQSMLFQSARFIGPSIAGLMLAAVGEAWCFLVNAVSYVVLVATYAIIRPKSQRVVSGRAEWWRDLASGFRYAFGFVGTRRLLLLLAAVGAFTAPWSPLMPIFAAEILHGDSRTLGFLIGAVGLGALAGTAFLAMRTTVRGLGRVVCGTSITAGIALAGFSLSPTLGTSLVLLPFFGFGLVATAAASNTILQTVADEDKRGRVISMYVMTFLGIAPIGNFIAGAAAERFGAPATLLACGILVAAAGSCFALGLPSWARAVRPVYLERGIPERRDARAGR
jgi:MFS family permease